jgi:hypothetical protein
MGLKDVSWLCQAQAKKHVRAAGWKKSTQSINESIDKKLIRIENFRVWLEFGTSTITNVTLDYLLLGQELRGNGPLDSIHGITHQHPRHALNEQKSLAASNSPKRAQTS